MKEVQSKLTPERGAALLRPTDEDSTVAQIERNRASLEDRRLYAIRHGYLSTLPDEILVSIIKFAVEAEQYEVEGSTCYPYGHRPALLQVNQRLYRLTRPIFFTSDIIYHLEHDLALQASPQDGDTQPVTKQGLEFLWSAWERSHVCGFAIALLNPSASGLRSLATLVRSFSQHSYLDGLTAAPSSHGLRPLKRVLPRAISNTRAVPHRRFVKLVLDRRLTPIRNLIRSLAQLLEEAWAQIFNDILSLTERHTFSASGLDRSSLARYDSELELYLNDVAVGYRGVLNHSHDYIQIMSS